MHGVHQWAHALLHHDPRLDKTRLDKTVWCIASPVSMHFSRLYIGVGVSVRACELVDVCAHVSVPLSVPVSVHINIF